MLSKKLLFNNGGEKIKFIVLGDRDGIPSDAIDKCLKSIKKDIEILYSTTEAPRVRDGISPESQKKIKDVSLQYDNKIIVILGTYYDSTSRIFAETVTIGDPSSSGDSLTNTKLGLGVYHIFEPEVKNLVDSSVFEEQCGLLEMAFDVDDIITAVKPIREQYSKTLL